MSGQTKTHSESVTVGRCKHSLVCPCRPAVVIAYCALWRQTELHVWGPGDGDLWGNLSVPAVENKEKAHREILTGSEQLMHI